MWIAAPVSWSVNAADREFKQLAGNFRNCRDSGLGFPPARKKTAEAQKTSAAHSIQR
jgi:hypothetical protein